MLLPKDPKIVKRLANYYYLANTRPMDRTVRRKYIDNWVASNGPNGMARLALKANVSTSLLEKARLGFVPKTEHKRKAIAEALNVNTEILFPVLEHGKEAS